ncbi:MAG: hypothetical protein KDN20_24135, partial [Verrucomicrobiae bacterium]|nr:hypothetical protein [Verrucomicrobiae bacterium]
SSHPDHFLQGKAVHFSRSRPTKGNAPYDWVRTSEAVRLAPFRKAEWQSREQREPFPKAGGNPVIPTIFFTGKAVHFF